MSPLQEALEPVHPVVALARPRPTGRVFGYQRWERLLFLHWRWDAAAVQRTLPRGLRVDTFDGRAWVGVVPFFMNRIRPAYLPPVPWLSYFLELNVRTYVVDEQGRSGVWFYSLDCNRALAVWLARAAFHLPYEHASMSARVDGDRVDYTSRRRRDARTARFVYQPTAPPRPADPDTLEFFLAERYRLFAADRRGRLFTGMVHHAPYPLSPARVDAHDPRVLELSALGAPGRAPDHALTSARVDVDIHALTAA